MKTKLRKLLAMLMTLAMFISSVPTTALAAIVPVSGGTQTSSGISLQSVVKPDDGVYVKFNFTVDGNTVSTQTVKKGQNETVHQPTTPTVETGRKFEGWFLPDGTEFTFGAQTLDDYTASTEVEVAAKFSAVYYVYFLTTDGKVYVTEEATNDNGYKVSLAAANKYEPKDAVLNGWVIRDTNTALDANTVVDADYYVTPVTTPAYWLTFNTAGGTGIDSIYVEQGKSVNLNTVAAPTKTGYTFGGWKDAAGNTVSGTITPTESMILTAVWNAAQVKYVVTYWGENANDTEFGTYLGSEEKTALTGTTVSGSQTLPSGTANSKHFTFSSTETKEVAADGSTVVNVNFSRNKYKVTFNLGNQSGRTMVVNGVTYNSGSNQTKYVMEAKFEENIESKWPTASNFTSGNFYGWSNVVSRTTLVSKRITMTDDLCATNGKTATADYGANCLDHLYYMFESFDQTSPENGNERKQFNGVYYDRSSAYSQDANSSGGDWNQKSISGLTADGVSDPEVLQEDWWGNATERNVFLYYSRNEYVLEKNNYGAVTTKTLKYGAPLDDEGATPERPAGFSENATFMGWYVVDVDQITETTPRFVFEGATMPYNKLGLYAYWVEPTITVNIVIDVEIEEGFSENATVTAGTSIASTKLYENALNFITRNNLVLIRWVKLDDKGNRVGEVDVNQPLYESTTIVPVFEGIVYTVTYDLNGGTGTTPSDANKYSEDAKACVANTDAKKGDEVFTYWTTNKDGSGTKYYPGMDIVMNANVTLYANYASVPGTVSVTYHSNFAPDATKTTDENTLVNGLITVAGYPSDLPARVGYKFNGWSTTKGGTTVDFEAGVSARLTAEGSNDLYAVWEANTDTKYTVEFYYQNKDGTYPDTANEKDETRTATTDTKVSVTDKDKAAKENGKYVYDESAANVEEGIVTGDGKLVLKLYFKLNTARYVIHHYLLGTKVKVADDETGEMDIGAERTAHKRSPLYNEYAAAEVDSYAPTQTMTIVADSTKNVITVYYTVPLTITARNADKTYDGTPLTQPDFDITGLVNGDAKEDFTVPMTKESTITDAGEQLNVIDELNIVYTGKTNTGGTIPSYYRVNYEEGKLTVNKRTVTLTSASADKVYDGKPLTNSNVTIGGQGFVTGEGATFNVTGTITNVGKVDNTFTYTLNEGTDANNYTITTKAGELEVTPVTDEVIVRINGVTETTTYDGNWHSVEGYFVSIENKDGSKNELYTEKDFTYNGTAKVEKTDASDTPYMMGLDDSLFVNNNEKNFPNVKFVVEEDGRLTINRRVVTLIPEEGHKTYDGTPLTKPDVAVTGEGFVEGEVSDIKANGSVTYVYQGKVLNNVTYTTGDNFKETNYNITIEEKYLWIDPVEEEVTVTIEGHTADATYDGAEHTVSGYEVVSISDDRYTTADFDFNGKAEKTAIDAGSYPMGLKDTDFANNNRNFNNVKFVVTDGNLTIAKRDVTFTGESKSLPYTGSVQSITGIEQSGLVEGHTYELGYKAEGQNVGSYDGAFDGDVVIKDAQGNVVTKNYNVTQTPGKLTITNASFAVTFTGESAEKVYNGEEQSITGITVVGLKPGHKYVKEDLTYVAKGTDKGEYKGEFTGTVKILDENNVDVTENYAITKTPGKLTITAVTDEVVVTITGHKTTATYNGAEHTTEGYDVSINNTLYKEAYFTFSGTDKVTKTNAGTYPMNLKESDFQNTSKNFTNVKFIVNDGELVINKRLVKVTAELLTYAYDYANPVAHPADDVVRYTVEAANGDRGLLAGDTLNVDVLYDNQNTQTLIGVYQAVAQIAAAKITNSNGDVTANYTIEKDDSTLTITGNDPLDPKKETTNKPETNYTVGDEITYTITVKNVSKDEAKNVVVTDSMAEIIADVNNLYTVSADGHTATIASIPAGGTVLVKAKHIVTAEDVEKAVKETEGTLTNVANIEFGDWSKDVTGDHDKLNDTYKYFVYYYWDGYVDANGDRVEVKTSESGTATVGGEVTEDPANVENYTPVSTESKKLTIQADESKNVIEFYYYKNVELTANSDEKVYNGSEWTVEGYTIAGENTDAAGNKIPANFSDITVGAKGTDVGTYPANFAEGTVGTVDKNGQYIIVDAKNGQLVITPITEKTITITAKSDSKTYDGTALTNNGFTYTEDVLVKGDVLTAVVEGSATNVGDEGKNVVKSYKVMRGNVDVTKNYTFTDSIDGKLTINPRKVTLTSETASKEYDGTPLTRPTVTVTGDGFVAGEVSDIKATGSVTYVTDGTVENTIKYTKSASFKDANYDIEEYPGTLTITAKTAKITITANSASKTYDGTALTDSGFSYTEDVLVKGDKLEAVVEGSQTNADSSDNIVKSYKVTRNGEDVTKNYTFTESKNGTLTVTPVAIELTAASASKAYDGAPLTRNEYTITTGAFVEGEGLATVTIVGSQTLVGSSENKITGHTLKNNTLARNYDIKYVDGTLTVTQNEKTITITANSKTWEYDGQPHSDGGYTVEYDGKKYEVKAGESQTLPTGDIVTATVKGSVTNVADSADNNNVVTEVTITNEAGTVVNDQYKTITKVPGGLKITQRGAGDMKVELKAADNTVVYDGQPHGAKLNDKDQIEVGTSYTITNLAEGHSVKTVAIDGSQTEVGVYPNELVPSGAIIVDEKGNDVTKNYLVTYKEGNLEITSPDTVIVTIRGNKDTVEYDGQKHEVNGYEVVSISNTLYTENDFGFADGAKAHAEGTDVGDYFMNLTDKSFVNKNGNFTSVTFVVVDGQLTITKRGAGENKVKIIAANNSVYYDGQPHGAKLNAAGQIEVNVSYTTEYLADGHKVKTVAIDGSETMVGVYEGKLVPNTAIIVDENDNDVTKNYEITYVPGTLEIKKNETEIKVTANSHTWEYDGEAHSDGGYTVTYGEESYTVAAGESATLSTGDVVTAKVEGSVTNVADSADDNNVVTNVTITNKAGTEVNDQYKTITKVPGGLKITKRGDSKDDDKKVKIIAEPNTVEYDGKAHGAKLNAKGEIELDTSYTTVRLVEGHYVDETTLDITGSQTNVGEYKDELKPAVKAGATEIVIRDAKGNDVTANYELTLVPNTLTITGDKIEPNKTVENEKPDSNYNLGDEIVFTITVKNVSIYPVKDVEVVDENAIIQESVNGDYEVINEHKAKIANIEPNGVVEVKAVHIVTSDDILAGRVGNVANVKWDDGEKTVDADTTKLTPPDVTLVVTKTSDWEGKSTGAELEVGTKITYTIKVTNNGNVPAANVRFADVLQKGDATVTGDIPTYGTLGVGEANSKSFTVEYVVTEADLIKGSILNEVTANADDINYTYYVEEDGEKVQKTGTKTVDEAYASVEDDTVEKNASTKSTKTTTSKPANGDGYALGETITYDIVVENDGNLTVTDIEVVDNLEGAEIKAGSGYDVVNGKAVIAELKPGESVTVKVEYVVTEADILAGTVVNDATVTGKGPDGTDPEPDEPGTDDPTDKPKATLEIVKDVVTSETSPKNGTSYALGEKITYTLTVKVGADNNVTVKNIKVTDTLLTAENVNKKIVEIAGGYTLNENNEIVLPEMKPGAKDVVITYTYTVQESDLGSGAYGTVHNAATAKGTTPDPKNPDDKPKDPEDEAKKDTKTNIRLIITANGYTVEYDGTLHGERGYEQEGLASGHEITGITISGGQTNVGKYEGEFKPTVTEIKDAEGNVVTDHYEITHVPGTLEITQSTKVLKVTANDGEWVYDGKQHSDGGYTVTYGKESYTVKAGDSATLSTGDKVTAVITKQVKNVSDTAEGNNKIVTLTIEHAEQYANVETENGTLTITPKPLTITADSASKEYDGTPLTKNSYTKTELAEGDTIESVTITGEITEVGSKDNVASGAVIKAGDEDVTGNYAIKYEKGKLTITQSTKVLKVTANDGEWVYDGKQHSDGGYTVTYGKESYTVKAGDSATLSTGDKVTAVITKQVKNVSDTAEGNNKIVTLTIEHAEQYANVETENGTLTITPKPLTITADSASKEYDGTPLTKNSYTKTELAEGDTIESVTITGEITEVGSKDNVASGAVIKAGDEDVTGNYAIKYEKGKLTITQSTKVLKVTANDGEWVYDGKQHSDGGYTVTYGKESYTVKAGDSATLSTGDKVTAVITKQVKNVSDTAEGNNEIVTLTIEHAEQYANVETANGTLTITAKKLTITADSDEKFYDGTPLTKDGYTNTELAEGDTIESVTITGEITEVGSVDNVASGAVIKAGDEDVTGNYDIKYEKGTLTIKAIPADGFMDVTVTKTWDDANNQDGKRDDVTLTLNASANRKLIDWDVLKDLAKNGANLTMDETDEHVFAKAEFTDDKASYSYTFKNVPKYANYNDKDNTLIVFGVTENGVPEFYEIDEKKSTNLEIVNVHEVKTMNIHVTKVWDDENNNDGYRPDAITVKLYADGELYGEKTVTPDENDVWETLFEDLPVYKKGEKIGYTVEEDAIDEYTATYSNEEPIVGGDYDEAAHEVTITNRYEIKKLNLTVIKIWADAGNTDKLRPSELSFNLYKTVGDGEKELVQEFQLKSSNGTSVWKHKDLRTTLEGLNVYENGEKVHYSIEETTKLEGYRVSYMDNDTVGGNKVKGQYQTEFTTWVTNSHTLKRPNRLIGPMGMTSGECVE